MDEKYKEVQFFSTIDKAVKELLSYKEKGILACGKFDNITLYSDTVTLDEAYMEIKGKTKAEFDKCKKQSDELYEKKEKEFKEKTPELVLKYQNKGREILTEDKWNDWDKVVLNETKALYKGKALDDCLNIIKILNNNGTLDKAKREINNQCHSGYTFRIVCLMVEKFCSRGSEFVDYVN